MSTGWSWLGWVVLVVGCSANPQGAVGRDGGPEIPFGTPPPGLELPASGDAPPSLDVADPDTGPDADADSGLGPIVLPESLRPEIWLAHLQTDILPYWTSSAALGSPAGNSPTHRGMDGSLQQPDERRPRMLSRQVFALTVGFMMTGETALLSHALDGVDWLAAHAVDSASGGFHPLLDGSGNPTGNEPKTAQDTAYAALGPALVSFVSRDPAALALVTSARDQLFDSGTFFDAGNGRIRDAMSSDMTASVDLEGDGGAELVAQLDPITALLLHVERALPAAAAAQARTDLVTLGQALLDGFYGDGMFWGVSNQIGVYGSKHADFGHALKAVWALHLIDARVPTPAFAAIVSVQGEALLERAWDADGGRWAKRPQSGSVVEYGSDWWIYAEADQLLATLGTDQDRLAETAGHWLADYVDTTRPARELVPSVDRYGAWVWDWTDDDTAKCNGWKSGYHSSEHALVMYLAGHAAQGTPATLHFAVDAAAHHPTTVALYPYVFGGTEVERRVGAVAQVSGRALTVVEVDFLVAP